MAQAAAYFLLDGNANVVLAGDHRQLGLIYSFQVEDTKEGLFECVFTDMQDAHRVTPTALDTNYRTNDEIAARSRERFYPEGYEAVRPGRRLSLTLSEPAGGVPEDWPELVPWGEELSSTGISQRAPRPSTTVCAVRAKSTRSSQTDQLRT